MHIVFPNTFWGSWSRYSRIILELCHHMSETSPLQIQKTFIQFRSKISPMVSGFIFRSLNHFEFIFTCGMWQCSNFVVFHVAMQHFHHYLLKRLCFLHVCSRLIYGKLTVNAWDYFWALLSFPLIFVPLCQYCTVLITVVLNIVWRL